MGPSVAKIAAGELFEGSTYEQIQNISPETAYQIFQVSDNLRICLRDLASFRYIDALRTNAYLVVFSVVVKTFQEVGVIWGDPEFTELLDDHNDDWKETRDEVMAHNDERSNYPCQQNLPSRSKKGKEK